MPLSTIQRFTVLTHRLYRNGESFGASIISITSKASATALYPHKTNVTPLWNFRKLTIAVVLEFCLKLEMNSACK